MFSKFHSCCWVFAFIVGLGVTASAQVQPDPAAPPSATAPQSAAELEKLVGPIALYPDPLISIVLPAAVYPLEIVQAARFVRDTNNIPKIDDQPWDVNVKSVAKIPAALKQLDDDLNWTTALGEAFVAQQKDVMDAIQTMRHKAQSVGTLQTSPQQNVIVTNVVVVVTNVTQVVTVTNQIIQIEPTSPTVVYVPTYSPSVVYYPPPNYVYNPVAPLITFGVGVAVGAIIANNCDWHHGGVWVGGGYGWGGGYHGGNNVNININNNNFNNINVNNNNRPNGGNGSGGQPWRPDSKRQQTAGAMGSANTQASRDNRGWGSSSAATTRPSVGNTSSGIANASAGTGNARPSYPGGNASASARPAAAQPAANRPSPAAAPAARPSPPATPAARPNPSPSTSPAMKFPTGNSGGNSSSAFGGGGNGANTRNTSNRGAASRSGGGGGGGGGGGRGGGRR